MLSVSHRARFNSYSDHKIIICSEMRIPVGSFTHVRLLLHDSFKSSRTANCTFASALPLHFHETSLLILGNEIKLCNACLHCFRNMSTPEFNVLHIVW